MQALNSTWRGKWMINHILYKPKEAISYPCPNLIETMLVNVAPGNVDADSY